MIHDTARELFPTSSAKLPKDIEANTMMVFIRCCGLIAEKMPELQGGFMFQGVLQYTAINCGNYIKYKYIYIYIS